MGTRAERGPRTSVSGGRSSLILYASNWGSSFTVLQVAESSGGHHKYAASPLAPAAEQQRGAWPPGPAVTQNLHWSGLKSACLCVYGSVCQCVRVCACVCVCAARVCSGEVRMCAGFVVLSAGPNY